MNLDEFIEFTDEAGFEWAADEMVMYMNHPDLLESDDQIPEFRNLTDERSLPMIHFYLGLTFGIGFQKRHET